MKASSRSNNAGAIPLLDVGTSVRVPAIPCLSPPRDQTRGMKSPGHQIGGDHSSEITNGNHKSLKIVILGLSITSSWGNGHATTYRGLVRELAARGHRVLFLERDADWYAANRDLPKPKYCRVALYSSLRQLRDRFTTAVRNADLVVVGSYVEEGIAIGEWVTRIAQGVTSFYDIDTPVTLAKLENDGLGYLSRSLIPKYDIYFSFTGGPILEVIQKRYGAPKAQALYCSVDPEQYFPEPLPSKWDLGYMGTYSDDRQPALDELLLRPAREWNGGRFVVAGLNIRGQFAGHAMCGAIPICLRRNTVRSTTPNGSPSISLEPIWWRRAIRQACVCSRPRPVEHPSSAIIGKGWIASFDPIAKY